MEGHHNARYAWRERGGRGQSVELFKGRYLRMDDRRRPKSSRTFTVDVACLSPRFERYRISRRRWLFGSITGIAMAVGAGYAATLPATAAYELYLLLGAVAAMGLAGVMLALHLRSMRHGFRLLTRHAGLVLFEVECPHRSKSDALSDFLARLHAWTEHAGEGRSLSTEALRSGEIRTLRRLANKAVIEQPAYEQAKQLILRL